MPTYTYQCVKCDNTQDEFHLMSASPKVVCGTCGSGRMKRRLGTGAGIIFKGSGFYETDYKSKKNGGSESKGEKAGASAKSDSGACTNGCGAGTSCSSESKGSSKTKSGKAA